MSAPPVRAGVVIRNQNLKAGKGRLFGIPQLQICHFNVRWYHCRDRKRHRERAALSFALAFGDDSPAMRMHKFADDREAKTKASMSPGFRRFCLSKAIRCDSSEPGRARRAGFPP